MMSQNVKVF